jgi:hypothetical protein
MLSVLSGVNTSAGAPLRYDTTVVASQRLTLKDRLEANPVWWVLVFLGIGCAAGWRAAWWYAKHDRPKVVTKQLEEVDESTWLDAVVTRLSQCQEADIYLRYFRDPDADSDPRLEKKRDQVRLIMSQFARLLLDNSERVWIVAYRKKSWSDDPLSWLVRQMRATCDHVSETQVRDIVARRVRVINSEPTQNSSTIYLLDRRYLFYNRVTGGIGAEVKTYHIQDLSDSVLPTLLSTGLHDLCK